MWLCPKCNNNTIKHNCNGTVQLSWNKELPTKLMSEIAEFVLRK